MLLVPKTSAGKFVIRMKSFVFCFVTTLQILQSFVVCDVCNLQDFMQDGPFMSVDSSNEVTSQGTYDSNVDDKFVQYTTAPISVIGDAPKEYDCIESRGAYYLLKARKTVEDDLAGLEESDVYMCQKVFNVDDNILIYFVGQSEFIQRGLGTIVLAGDNPPDICTACNILDDNTGTVLSKDSYNLLIPPSTGGAITPPDLVNDIPDCGTDPPNDDPLVKICEDFLAEYPPMKRGMSDKHVKMQPLRQRTGRKLRRRGKGNGKGKDKEEKSGSSEEKSSSSSSSDSSEEQCSCQRIDELVNLITNICLSITTIP